MSWAEIEPHIPPLRRYARALTGNAADADDLVQDCLERALSRLGLFRRGTNMRAWLYTIMRNLWLNQLQQQGAQPLHAIGDEIDSGGAPSQEHRLAVRDLAAALALLSPEQREAVLLVGLEGLSYSDVAQVTGSPIGTVMSRLKRGRDRLALLMQGAEPVLRRVK